MEWVKTNPNFGDLLPLNSVVTEQITFIKEIKSKMKKDSNYEKAMIFNTTGTVSQLFTKTLFYNSCPTCKKKLVEINVQLKCENCNAVVENPEVKYALKFRFNDISDFIICYAFDEGEKILGRKPDELKELFVNDENEFRNVLKQRLYKEFFLKIKASWGFYNERRILKFQVIKANAPNYKSDCDEMIKRIEFYMENFSSKLKLI